MGREMSTLRIDRAEWRSLFLENIQRLANFVGQNVLLTPEGLKVLHTHLDRSKMIAAAWCAAAAPVAPVPAPAPSAPFTTEADGVVGQPIGEPVKKRGGWPKGKPRKRQKPRGAA
jgi:hypothetical protein